MPLSCFDYDYYSALSTDIRRRLTELKLERYIERPYCLFVGSSRGFFQIFWVDDCNGNRLSDIECYIIKCDNNLICKYDVFEHIKSVLEHHSHNIEFCVCYCVLYGKWRVIKLFILCAIVSDIKCTVRFAFNRILISNHWHNYCCKFKRGRARLFPISRLSETTTERQIIEKSRGCTDLTTYPFRYHVLCHIRLFLLLIKYLHWILSVVPAPKLLVKIK